MTGTPMCYLFGRLPMQRPTNEYWADIVGQDSDQPNDLLDDRFGCSSWLKPWVPRGWHWVRSFVMRAAGGCLDKMTPSQTPGLPFKQRQMGPNSQTCPHLNYKHCQRHNGPEDWVHLTKVTSWGHITNSNTNLDQISSSESRPSINFKISSKHQHLD